jgi:hypothetical protein
MNALMAASSPGGPDILLLFVAAMAGSIRPRPRLAQSGAARVRGMVVNHRRYFSVQTLFRFSRNPNPWISVRLHGNAPVLTRELATLAGRPMAIASLTILRTSAQH